MQLFPENIDTFIDLFAGGFNVAVNVKANKTIKRRDFYDRALIYYAVFSIIVIFSGVILA